MKSRDEQEKIKNRRAGGEREGETLGIEECVCGGGRSVGRKGKQEGNREIDGQFANRREERVMEEEGNIKGW